MPSPAVLDFEKLLKPITADKPAGSDPRADISASSIYQSIKDARRAAREAEKKIIAGEANAESPNWRAVRDACVEALTKQAKDLEIAAYLIEALLRDPGSDKVTGFAGLRDGFRLAREFAEKFWDGLFPTPEEDQKDEEGRIEEYGIKARIMPLIGLNGEDAEGTLAAPIARVPVTDLTSEGKFATSQYNEAKNLKTITDVKLIEKRIAAGAVTLEKFERAVVETARDKPDFYRIVVDDVNAAVVELTKLGGVLDNLCKKAGMPSGMPTSDIKKALTVGAMVQSRQVLGVLAAVQEFAKNYLTVVVKQAETGPKSEGPAPTGPQQAPPPPPGVISTRPQALEALRKVAEFFRNTEPHSPLSYTLEQVIRWAGMPFADLWSELIADEAPRKAVFKQVGVAPAAPPKK